MSPINLVDVAELTPVDAEFITLSDVDGAPVNWVRHSGRPQSAVERIITRPRLSRYRAAWNAAVAGRRARAIISHMPRMTAAVADFTRVTRASAPHLAFSFNFTQLPRDADLARFRRSLTRVDQFAVYTAFEADRYAELFDLPRDRFRPLLWTQATPAAATVDRKLLPSKPFVVAVGGEGRDFAMLTKAARALPEVPFVVIARPTGELSDIPSNMTLRFNIPSEVCWGIASKAAALLVPLFTSDTCCGHITLVSGRMLGLPIITTRSAGTREYSEGFGATQLVPAGNVDAWIAAISEIMADPDRARTIATAEAIEARERHSRHLWVQYVADFIRANP